MPKSKDLIEKAYEKKLSIEKPKVTKNTTKKSLSVQDIAKKSDIKSLKVYNPGKGRKWVKPKVKKPETEAQKNAKRINKLNTRKSKLLGQFDMEDKVQEYYAKRILEKLKDIENLEFTKTGRISAKTKDEYAIQSAENILKTLPDFYDELRIEYYGDNPEKVKERESEGYHEDKTELLKYMALKIVEEDYINDKYEAALTKFYNLKPSDINAEKMQAYNEILRDMTARGNERKDYETRFNELHNFIDNINKFNNDMSASEYISKFVRGGF